MPSNPVVSPLPLDLVGVFVFALSGGLVAVRKRFDLFGVLVLAGAAGLGGGILRDLLIGITPAHRDQRLAARRHGPRRWGWPPSSTTRASSG